MRPPTFAAELSGQWSRWVLEHGLPELPGPHLEVGDSVPVAYWTGPSTAAVGHVRRLPDDEDEPTTQVDVDLFGLGDSGWEPCGGGGGSWHPDPVLARVDVPADHVDLHGTIGVRGADRGCLAHWGEVGAAAATVEVVQAGRVTRRSIEPRVGLLVVCADPAQRFEVRVLDAGGRVLGRRGRAT